MEESAIRKGFANLLDSRNYDRLYDAALCRAKADWLIGINGTRLFTTLYHGKTLNVGRVLTPTLALLVEREAAIASFKKEKFYTVELELEGFRPVSGRLASKTDAEKLRKSCLGKTVCVKSILRQDKTERPPKLYDLTTLQREANRLFDYTAQQTLDYLQSLYEKRLATYPRTDSRYLTGDMAAGLPALCQGIAGILPFALGADIPVHPAQVVDNSRVSDHHAIIPTREAVSADLASLPTGERNILFLVSVRLLCAVGNPHIYEETAVTVTCGGVDFSSKGKAVTDEGWKAIDRTFRTSLKQKPEPEERSLPRLQEGQSIPGAGAVLREGQTAPPRSYTEDTILAAMEHAGAEDFAEIENLERKGLGTPATRAAVLEKLVRSGFAERRKKQFLPTDQGMELIRVMPEQLKSAKLTAEWENKLKQVERGELAPADFMAGIEGLTASLIKTYAGVSVGTSALSQPDRAAVGVCPRCGKPVVEGKKSFFCLGYHDTPSCGFALWKNDRFFTNKHKQLTKKTAAALLKDGRVPMTGLFSEKKGVLYDAVVVMDDDGGRFVRFHLEFDNKKKEGASV